MQNDDYIKFADKSTVEVLALGSLDKGVEKKDKKAATYTKEVNGEKVEFLIEFPNLTIDEVLALSKSKAGSFNDTGRIPFCCLVDPWTEKEIVRLPTISVQKIQEAVKEAKKQLVKEHGPGMDRAALKQVTDAECDALAAADAGDFAKAILALDKPAKAAKDAQPLQDRLNKTREQVVAKAKESLDAAISACADDAAIGKKALSALVPKLKGTGLEGEAAEKLKELSASAGG